MENTSQKLFSPWLILIILLVLGVTFYKTMVLNDFEVINTESEEVITEEGVDEEETTNEEPLIDSALDDTSTSTIIKASSTEPVEAI
jgi:hypothetical protein